MPTLAASSSSSCSPPEARQYDVRSKRRKVCAQERISRDYSVTSPRKKSSKSHSIDETLETLSNMIKRVEQRAEQRHEKRLEKRQDMYRVEMGQVKQILFADGYKENDDVFMQVMNLCRDEQCRHDFLDLNTKEGRSKWVEVTWAFHAMTAKR